MPKGKEKDFLEEVGGIFGIDPTGPLPKTSSVREERLRKVSSGSTDQLPMDARSQRVIPPFPKSTALGPSASASEGFNIFSGFPGSQDKVIPVSPELKTQAQRLGIKLGKQVTESEFNKMLELSKLEILRTTAQAKETAAEAKGAKFNQLELNQLKDDARAQATKLAGDLGLRLGDRKSQFQYLSAYYDVYRNSLISKYPNTPIEEIDRIVNTEVPNIQGIKDELLKTSAGIKASPYTSAQPPISGTPGAKAVVNPYSSGNARNKLVEIAKRELGSKPLAILRDELLNWGKGRNLSAQDVDSILQEAQQAE